MIWASQVVIQIWNDDKNSGHSSGLLSICIFLISAPTLTTYVNDPGYNIHFWLEYIFESMHTKDNSLQIILFMKKNSYCAEVCLWLHYAYKTYE